MWVIVLRNPLLLYFFIFLFFGCLTSSHGALQAASMPSEHFPSGQGEKSRIGGAIDNDNSDNKGFFMRIQ